MNSTRIIICDRFPIVRAGLRSIFAPEVDLEVIAEVQSEENAIKEARRLRADVLIADVNVSGYAGHRFLKHFKDQAPSTAVLIFSSQKEEHFAASAFRAGARGFINKERTPEAILAATRRVAKGQLVISHELAHRLATIACGQRPLADPHEHLTRREMEVFNQLVSGSSVGEIARMLHLSSKTVSTHKCRIFKKLNLDNISALVQYAIRHDLI